MNVFSTYIFRFTFVFACLAGGLSVLVDAYAAHAPGIEDASLRSVNSAIQMMQFHALILIMVAWMAQAIKVNWFLLGSALFFITGILLFSCNIVLHQLAGISHFRALTPFGGIAFVAGWIALAINGLNKSD